MKKAYNNAKEYGSRIFHCSNCNYGVDDIYEGAMWGNKEQQKQTIRCLEEDREWNYCPVCGAKIITE